MEAMWEGVQMRVVPVMEVKVGDYLYSHGRVTDIYSYNSQEHGRRVSFKIDGLYTRLLCDHDEAIRVVDGPVKEVP